MDDAIHDHIRAAGRPSGETGRLVGAIVGAAWPGGVVDRTDPVARGWLRMWGPIKLVVAVPECGCEYGRCTICN
jgi:hypothetical protein